MNGRKPRKTLEKIVKNNYGICSFGVELVKAGSENIINLPAKISHGSYTKSS
jgi:hypothetical protein